MPRHRPTRNIRDYLWPLYGKLKHKLAIKNGSTGSLKSPPAICRASEYRSYFLKYVMYQGDCKVKCPSGYHSPNFNSPVIPRCNGTQVTTGRKKSFVFQFTSKIFCVLNLENDCTLDGRYGRSECPIGHRIRRYPFKSQQYVYHLP